MRRLIPLLVFVAGCTPHQIQLWKDWHREDPVAALEFIEGGCAGMCWTDETADPEDLPDLGGWGECEQWMTTALAAGWTEEQWGTLNWIMARESGCDPGATSSAGAQGLLQVMPMWADDCGGGSLYDPWFNLACGLHVYHAQGWSAWDVY